MRPKCQKGEYGDVGRVDATEHKGSKVTRVIEANVVELGPQEKMVCQALIHLA